jgi:tetratricopeptide (TPR) repeat protein
VASFQQSYQGRMAGWRSLNGRPSALADSKNDFPSQPSKNDPNALVSTENDEEEFSYAKLSSMWKQKDNQRLEITPPTPRTPLRFSTSSCSISKPSIPTPNKNTSYPFRAHQNFHSNGSTKPAFKASKASWISPVKPQQEIDMTSPDVDTSIPDEDITSTLTKIQANIPVYKDDDVIESEDEEIQDATPKQLWKKKDDVPKQQNIKRHNFMSNLPNAGSDSSDEEDDSHNDKEMEQIMKAQMSYGVSYHNQAVKSPDTELKSMQKRALSNFQLKLPPRAPKKAPNPSKRPDDIQDSNRAECITPMKPKVLTLDPYDALDSMSMINSEVTVQMENKHSVTFLNAFEKKKEKIASELLEDTYDVASHIPDSAFGISAAVLQKLANDRKIGLAAESRSVQCHVNESSVKISNEEEYHAVSNNVPKVKYDANSDVFDGLSEVTSPAFFSKSPSTPNSSIHKLTETPSEGTLSSRRTRSSSSNKTSTNGISRPRQRSMERERNEEAKKRFTKNLAAFATKVATSEQKSVAPSLHLNISKSVSTKKNKASVINLGKALTNTLEAVGEGQDADKEHDSIDGPSFRQEDIIGISRIDANDAYANVSEYLEVLTTPIQLESQKKSVLKDSHMSDSSDKIHDDESSVCNGAKDVSKKMLNNLSDSESKIGWVPSVLRLYKMHDFSPPKSDRSPTSTMHFVESSSKNFEVSIEDCRLRGLQSIILCRGLRYGDNLDEPSRIISDGKLEMNRSTFSKLKHFNSANINNGQSLQRKCYHMFEKMTEIHENALNCLQEDKKDEALQVYESFFESYSNQELICHDRGMEKRIISTILYNMGIIYLALDECELALDFLKEARGTFEDSDSNERYPSDMGTIYNAIGVAQFACGEYGKSLMILADSLAIRQSLDDKLGMVESLSNIGCVYVALEEIDTANESMEEALDIARSYCKSCFKKERRKNVHIQRVLSDTADVLCNMSYLYHLKYRSSEKSEYLMKEALSIYESIEFREDMCDTINSLMISSSAEFCEV